MKGSMEFTALGSGSGGNAFAVRSPEDDATLLVDAGFSCRELRARLAAAGIAPQSVRALLLTHDHGDHIAGCRSFCDALRIPLYAGGGVLDYLDGHGGVPVRACEFEPGLEFSLAGFDVRTFPVSHDADDPVGFVFRREGASLGLATDLGVVDEPVRQALCGCGMLVLESNYDTAMLEASSRPFYLKQRIRGRRGHLGNDDAMNALPGLIGEATCMLTLVHVSRECNDYALVRGLARAALAGLGRSDIYLDVATQNEVRPTFRFPGRSGHGAE